MFGSDDLMDADYGEYTSSSLPIEDLPAGQITCPKCGKSDRIQTSSYEQADYYCGHCTVWFGAEEEFAAHLRQRETGPAEKLGDALERLIG